MSVLSSQTISKLSVNRGGDAGAPLIAPFSFAQQRAYGKTWGLGPCGYDVRLNQTLVLYPGSFVLGSIIETLNIPHDITATVMDKSTWARQGITLQTTIVEPGFIGGITLEISNNLPWWTWLVPWRWKQLRIVIPKGAPIAQLVFHRLDFPTDHPYRGKYQYQSTDPTPAIQES